MHSEINLTCKSQTLVNMFDSIVRFENYWVMEVVCFDTERAVHVWVLVGAVWINTTDWWVAVFRSQNPYTWMCLKNETSLIWDILTLRCLCRTTDRKKCITWLVSPSCSQFITMVTTGLFSTQKYTKRSYNIMAPSSNRF